MKKGESLQLEEMKNLLEKALVAVRESAPGYSQAIVTLTKQLQCHMDTYKTDMDEMKEKLAGMEEKLNPVHEAFVNANGTAKTIIFISKIAASIGAITGAIITLKHLLK